MECFEGLVESDCLTAATVLMHGPIGGERSARARQRGRGAEEEMRRRLRASEGGKNEVKSDYV